MDQDPALEALEALEQFSLWGIIVALVVTMALAIGAAVGIYFDGRRRRLSVEESLAWATGAFFMLPLALPAYLWRAYYKPVERVEPIAVLPWVRGLNYLMATGFVALIPLVVLFALMIPAVLIGGPELGTNMAFMMAAQSLTVGTFIIAWTYAVRYFVDRRKANSLGTPLNFFDTVVGQAAGVGLGLALALAMVGILLALGAVDLRWAPTDGGTRTLAYLIVPLYIAAFMEEIVMRGYLQRTLYLSWGHVPAVLVSALVFALMHAMNPGLTVLALFNILLIGVFFSLTVILTGRLWFAIGMHVTWNLVTGPVLAFEVSGMELNGLFETTASGPDWLTGGAFGLEGSVVFTGLVVLLVAAALVATKIRNRFEEPQDESATRPVPAMSDADSIS